MHCARRCLYFVAVVTHAVLVDGEDDEKVAWVELLQPINRARGGGGGGLDECAFIGKAAAATTKIVVRIWSNMHTSRNLTEGVLSRNRYFD
jgi:hypothetical protein